MTDTSALIDRSQYRLWATDTARYGDTDRQGHINNTAFSIFLETGRVGLFFDPAHPFVPSGCAIVIARLLLEYRAELHWGGPIEIGTKVLVIGRSSFTLGQGIFQDGICAATASTVLVLQDESTRKSTPLPPQTRARLDEFT